MHGPAHVLYACAWRSRAARTCACTDGESVRARACAALGFSSWQRAIISHAGQSYTLEHGSGDQGDTLKIVTHDLRGTSELELPLSGKAVAANDGDNGARVHRSAFIKGSPPAVIVTERFPDQSEPYSICKRTLQPDGRMW